MSLNNINLSPYLIAQLYQNVLIEEDKLKTFAQEESIINWKYLGNNAKNILVVVNYTQATHIPDEQMDFLSKIINSCKLSMEDICLVNMCNYPNVAYDVLLKKFNSRNVLLFGVSTNHFGFPFEIPAFQVQQYDKYTIIHSPALQDIKNDEKARGQLWKGLKKIFNI